MVMMMWWWWFSFLRILWSFAVADIRAIDSVNSFKRALKTSLFRCFTMHHVDMSRVWKWLAMLRRILICRCFYYYDYDNDVSSVMFIGHFLCLYLRRTGSCKRHLGFAVLWNTSSSILCTVFILQLCVVWETDDDDDNNEDDVRW